MDCFLNVIILLEIFGIEGDGICDVSEMLCDQIFVVGDDFIEIEMYYCKIDVIYVRLVEVCLEIK